MNERQQDWEWLRDFSRKGDQAAFAAVVRRHLDLVYATALRKLEDTGGAEEVTQNVFSVLARKSWQFAPDDSLPAWLHRSALLEASAWLRGELRRRRREKIAVQLETTMKIPDPDPALRALVPLLDEGLLSLPEKDRTALLLRYYENRPLKEVGAALGVSEDAARKRVGTALELVTRFFRRRGFQTATVTITVAALQHTATAAPAIVATAMAQSALHTAPPALSGLTGVLSRLASLTKIQTAACCVALTALPVGWQWHQSQVVRNDASMAQTALQQTGDHERQLESSIDNLRSESSRLDTLLAQADQTRARQQEAEAKGKALRKRLQGLLTATDYRWPKDLPFVRIPKSALKKVFPGSAINYAGKLEDWGAELLCLTPDERQQAEEALRDHTESLAQSAADRAYVTNYVPEGIVAMGQSKISQSVWVPAPTPDDPAMTDGLRGRLNQIVGENRVQLLLGDGKGSSDWLGTSENSQTGKLYTVCLDPTDPDGLAAQYIDGNGGGCHSSNTNEVTLTLPSAIAIRFFDPWLNQMGITNTATRSNP